MPYHLSALVPLGFQQGCIGTVVSASSGIRSSDDLAWWPVPHYGQIGRGR